MLTKKPRNNLAQKFKDFKVVKCRYCGKWAVTSSNIQFRCFKCNKTMVLKKIKVYGLNVVIHSSYDDASLAGEMVRKLNERDK